MQVRNCTEKDVDGVRLFVDSCKPLTAHTAYTYWVLFTYFSDSCFVMEKDEGIVGYISGVKSTTLNDTFFLWQIGVAESERGKGHASLLVQKIVDAARKQGCKNFQTTIEPENEASFNTFSSFAKKNGLLMTQKGEVNYHDTLRGKSEHEIVYEISL